MPSRFSPSPVKIERYPKISAGFLYRLGLMRKGLERVQLLVSYDIRFLVFVRTDGNIEFITELMSGVFYLQNITYHYDIVGAVARPLFQCDRTGLKCRQFFLVNGVWASREGHGLTVKNGPPEQRMRRALLRARDDIVEAYTTTGKHRSTKKKTLSRLHELLRNRPVLPDALMPIDDHVSLAASEEQALFRNAFRSKHPKARTLAGPIARGCAASGSVELGVILTRPGMKSARAQSFEITATRRHTAPQDDHLCLDLPTLRSAELMHKGELTTRILDLPDILPGADRVVLLVDLRKCKASIDFVFMDQHATVVSAQSIKLVEKPSMPGRIFLQCPVAGTRHDALFFRDGFFASATVQRLKSRSQI